MPHSERQSATCAVREGTMSKISRGIRESILERDNRECQGCARGSSNVQLHVHHRTPKSDGGSDEEQNLLTLCKDCHNTIHNLPANIAPDGIEIITRQLGVGHLIDCSLLDCKNEKGNQRRTKTSIESLNIDCTPCKRRIRKYAADQFFDQESHMDYLRRIADEESSE